MQYNLMQFNVANPPSCTPPGLGSRLLNITSIVGYVKPDIFTVNEMNKDNTTADLILGAITSAGGSFYKRSPLNAGGQGDVLSNMVFYNEAKLTLISSSIISCNPRTANVYQFKHKGTLSGLNFTGNDVIMTFVSVHLKASNTTPDATTRGGCATNIVDFLNGHYDKSGNFFVQGDFNLYTNTEPAFQNFTNTINGIHFNDPVNKIGAWNNNSAFALYHSQCSRLAPSQCFAGGGLDDRFDFILSNKAVLNDSFYVKYIPNSYKVIGQDGNSFNQDVNNLSNNSAPRYILDALYNTSDHLPVSLKLQITVSTVPSYLVNKNPADVPSTIKGPYVLGSCNSMGTLTLSGLYTTITGIIIASTETSITIVGTNTHVTTSSGIDSYPLKLIGNFSVASSIMTFNTTSVVPGVIIADPCTTTPGVPTTTGLSLDHQVFGILVINPFSETLEIVITGSSQDIYHAELSDLYGRIVFQESKTADQGGKLSFDTSYLSLGTYILRVQNNQNLITIRKVVKQ
jgi:hypothetical protein